MIKPLPGYVLVEPIKDEAVHGGIYMPEDVNDKPSKGKVISIGEQLDLGKAGTFSTTVTKGQTVIFKKWVNQEVKFEGKEYLLVKFDELLGIIE